MSIGKGDELAHVIANYKEKWGFPMCAGAIDGTHIPISTPQQNHASYINRKIIPQYCDASSCRQ